MKNNTFSFGVALLCATTLNAAVVTWNGDNFTWAQPDADSFTAAYEGGDTAVFGNLGITDGTAGKTAIVVSGGLTPASVTFAHNQARYLGGASANPGGGFNYLFTSNGTANVITSPGNLTLGSGNTLFRALSASGTYNHSFGGALDYSGSAMLGLSSDNSARIMKVTVGSLANPTPGNTIVFNAITTASGNSSGAVWSTAGNRVAVTGSKPTMTNGMVSGGFQFYTGGNIAGSFMKLAGDDLVPLDSVDYVINTFGASTITRIDTVTALAANESAHAVRLSGGNITFDTNALYTLNVGSGGVILSGRSIGATTNTNLRGVLDFGDNHAWIGAYSAASQSNIHSRVVAASGVTIMGTSQSLNFTAPNNEITGTVHVNGGTASFAAGAISSANDVVVNALGRLTGPNTNATVAIGGLSGEGRVAGFFQGNNTTTNLVTISPASGTHVFEGVIANGDAGRVLSVTKSDDGTQVFGAASVGTYGGTTTVTGGELVIDGDFSQAGGAVNVTGGTLGGSGIIGGATTIGALGILAPGNSAGLLTFAGDLSLGGAATFEIGGTARGTGHDAVDVGSALTYGGLLTADIGFALTLANHTFNLFDFGSQGGTFTTITLAGLYSGTLDIGNAYSAASGGYTWTFAHDTGVLTAVVPEPAVYTLLGGLAALGLALLRRRRA